MARSPTLSMLAVPPVQADADAWRRASKVRLMAFDVDGVLTNGSLAYGGSGEALKIFHVHDGMGIRLLQKAGIQTAIITARSSAMVAARAQDLKITHVWQGADNKAAALAELLTRTGIRAEETGFIGDDVIDLPILAQIGFAATVPQAHPEVFPHVDYVTRARAGAGAVRELCDLILAAQGLYAKVYASFFAPLGTVEKH